MSNFIGNSQLYNMHSENEVAEILSNFETPMINHIMNDALNRRMEYVPSIPKPNLVNSLELNFKNILDCHTEKQAEIYEVRLNTYQEIIEMINQFYNLDWQPGFTSPSGFYSEASNMYDFFVGNFVPCMIEFFAQILMREYRNIYNVLPQNIKEEAEAAYSKKKNGKNMELETVLDNISFAVDAICNYDFGLHDIIAMVRGNLIADSICGAIVERGYFFKTFYVSTFQSDLRSNRLTDLILFMYQNDMIESSPKA